MPQREIQFPNDIILKDDDGNEMKDETGKPAVIPSGKFVKVLLQNPAFIANMDAIVIGFAIKAAYDKREEGKWTISDEDWTMLKAAIDKPEFEQITIQNGQPTRQSIKGFPFSPIVTPQLLPYMLAIKNAKQV